MGLNPRQRRFVDYYVKTGKAKDSAVRAGYSESSAASIASHILKKPEAQHLIEMKHHRYEEKNIAQLDEVLEKITEIIRDPDATKSEKLKASDLRLKTLGAYLEKHVVDSTNTVINVTIDDEVVEEAEDTDDE